MKHLLLGLLLLFAAAGCAQKADAPQPAPVPAPPSVVGTWVLTDDVTVTTYPDGRPPLRQELAVAPGDYECTFTAAGGLQSYLWGVAQPPSTYVLTGNKLTVTFSLQAGGYSEYTVSALTADRLAFYTGTTNAPGVTRARGFRRR